MEQENTFDSLTDEQREAILYADDARLRDIKRQVLQESQNINYLLEKGPNEIRWDEVSRCGEQIANLNKGAEYYIANNKVDGSPLKR